MAEAKKTEATPKAAPAKAPATGLNKDGFKAGEQVSDADFFAHQAKLRQQAKK